MGWMPLPGGITDRATSSRQHRPRSSRKFDAPIAGIDLTRNVVQIRDASHDGCVVFRKKLARKQILPFLEKTDETSTAQPPFA